MWSGKELGKRPDERGMEKGGRRKAGKERIEEGARTRRWSGREMERFGREEKRKEVGNGKGMEGEEVGEDGIL